MTSRAGWRAGACAAAAAVLLALAAARLAADASRARALLSLAHAELGHALRTGAHPASVDPTFRLPLGPLVESVLLLDAPAAAPWAFAAAALATAALAGAAGALLGGSAGGLLSAALALFVLAGLPKTPGFFKMLLFTPLTALPALALALRARRPGPVADWLTGAAFAAGLLYRSTLAFLPPLLAAWELARGRDRRSAASAARLLLPCLLAVLPWVWVNSQVNKTWTPFEHGASDMLVVGGALGMLDTTPEGDRRTLAPDAPEGPGVLGWAARRAAADPARFAAAVLRRLLFALGILPWLVLLAAAGLWRARRDPAARALAVFAGYFLGVHALLATLSYYYEPLWPVLAALAAGVLAAGAKDAASERRAGAVLLGACVAALAAATLAAATSVRYVSLRSDPPDLSASADPLSRWRRARLAVAAGRPEAALPDLDAALAVLPDLPRLRAEKARAQDALGDRRALPDLLASLREPAYGDDPRLDLLLWRTVSSAGRGDRAAAAASLRDAAALWRGDQRLTVARTPEERAWQESLRAGSDESLGRRAEAAFDGVALAAWAPAFGDAALEAAPLAARAPLLRLQEAGRRDLACPRLARLAERAPSSRAHIDQGVCAFLAGRRAEAVAAFERALRLDPSSAEAASSLAAARDTKAPSPSSQK